MRSARVNLSLPLFRSISSSFVVSLRSNEPRMLLASIFDGIETAADLRRASRRSINAVDTRLARRKRIDSRLRRTRNAWNLDNDRRMNNRHEQANALLKLSPTHQGHRSRPSYCYDRTRTPIVASNIVRRILPDRSVCRDSTRGFETKRKNLDDARERRRTIDCVETNRISRFKIEKKNKRNNFEKLKKRLNR